ncbi:MAG: hypothetical protein A3F31_01625 [Candidatus Levybacteria bacterium RIFCSPHIGHO2_12_FULL_38_12]|nr:MAG: hypothetical protein A2770_01135 [Candidatus Levybacteria bacterium RIFCSPHIGHO2_01_FULL_38_12]OGH22908.1 MAG: hypothetical protein A3F31_01625 [Candidatus Levybacteria bacterium RIFCSPHIGHO2_12_FULL_38_12]OGH34024.1 MAG: hypothetical protein A3A47_04865 [Candidatus Levybacteria bacterium RIFCSPLOWO2_01_FULL_37_20]OGH44832.1 MAG: hypothetical protein A3J14_05400 [Candidatus Levybacteria bacterium RIFCSPLOWO2_02_FULL_37_18]
MTTRQGFTLIELLIVITIIGVLASLLMSNFVGVRQRARDSQRKSDLRQIQSALEIYRSDQGSYPGSIPACGSALTSPPPDTSTVYMQKIPCDPLNTGEYVYTYTLTSGLYSLQGCLENYNDSQKDTPNDTSKCTGVTTDWSYTLTPP